MDVGLWSGKLQIDAITIIVTYTQAARDVAENDGFSCSHNILAEWLASNADVYNLWLWGYIAYTKNWC